MHVTIVETKKFGGPGKLKTLVRLHDTQTPAQIPYLPVRQKIILQ